MTSKEVELWQSLVDGFTSLSDGAQRTWVLERKSYPPGDENVEINAFLNELTASQCEVLAKMLVGARHSGIFDTLVVLHERFALRGGAYIENGIEMQLEPHGYKLFEDYTRRKAGDPWVYPVRPNITGADGSG